MEPRSCEGCCGGTLAAVNLASKLFGAGPMDVWQNIFGVLLSCIRIVMFSCNISCIFSLFGLADLTLYNPCKCHCNGSVSELFRSMK